MDISVGYFDPEKLNGERPEQRLALAIMLEIALGVATGIDPDVVELHVIKQIDDFLAERDERQGVAAAAVNNKRSKV